MIENDFFVIERELVAFAEERGSYNYFMTEDHLGQGVKNHSPLTLSSIDDFLKLIDGDPKPVFLYTPLIPGFFSENQIVSVFGEICFASTCVGKAENFLKKNQLNDFYGVQIRKTDFGSNGADDEGLFGLLKGASSKVFFVCSDDKLVEERFSDLSNVVVYEKDSYVEKLNPGDWMDVVTDFSGRQYRGNINRSAQSVKDALVDLLILSRSQIVKTSNSTFLASALYIQAARKILRPDNTLSRQPSVTMGIPLFETIQALGLPSPQGVLQVGASYGQEMDYFCRNGIRYGVFIEPLPEPFSYISERCKSTPGFVAVQALCAEESGQSHTFHVATNGGMSSSILKPANHLSVFDFVRFPEEIQMKSNTLDEIMVFLKSSGHDEIVKNIDTLYMDTQGAELRIMLGATQVLKNVNYIFTEVMRGELYERQASLQTVCAWLDVVGFTLNHVYFGKEHTGDALFVRKTLVGLPRF